MKLNRILGIGLVLLAQLAITSCSNNDGESVDPNAPLYKTVLTNVSQDVITKTYETMNTNSQALVNAISNFTIGDEAELTAMKNAWMATREPWEKSEGFLYGPVDTQGIDPAMDSWPVNVNDINAILNSSGDITPDLLENNNEARGFHTMEYFIWGLNGTKTAADFTVREKEYLFAAAQNLHAKTTQLYEGWIASGGNYQNYFITAGDAGNAVYTSQKTALLELVDGIITIADEVGNGKIETPLNGNNGGPKPEAEESRFSNNSKLDFANNIRSIQNIYLGDYNGVDGKGLTDIVAIKNATLDTNIKTKITAAINAIEAIPGTFTSAITNNRPEVQNAQAKVAELQQLLDSSLKPLISNL
ncbi:imelysin family protein [Flavobacterium wongokense]|uniref:imelysin family protein n=1 Tax=Flavobacterium wongokense TaxID=2910674 RepID=UPI001F15CD3D|nr:imelysin family protein [Flavobacterium sp. WG47]MCF6132014.1 imelysin [Flavobacterium sp. WG47]